MNNELSNEILTDIEKDKVAKFAEDTVTFNAVKKYILAVAYRHGVVEKGVEHKPGVNFALALAFDAINTQTVPHSNEELGENLRGIAQAIQLVESGFKEMNDIKDLKQSENIKSDKKENEAE